MKWLKKLWEKLGEEKFSDRFMVAGCTLLTIYNLLFMNNPPEIDGAMLWRNGICINNGGIRNGESEFNGVAQRRGHKEENRGFNPITGEPEVGEKISDNVVGYVAYMRLVNGFEKTLFMTTAEIEAHAKKYSQSYGKSYSPWTTNFEAMASKTVLKKLLNAWGILSADMPEAIQADQSVVDKNTFTYVDNGGNVQTRDELYLPEEESTVDVETGEVVEAEVVS